MSVFYLDRLKQWRYDFVRKGVRYQGACVDPATGAPAKSKRAAQDIEAGLKAEVSKGAKPGLKVLSGRYTLAEAFADYAENKAQFNRTWKDQQRQIKTALEFFDHAQPVEDITPEDVDKFISWLRAKPLTLYTGGPKKGAGEFRAIDRPRSASSVNGVLATLRAALRRAKKKQKVAAIPDIPRLETPNDLPNPLRPGDARKIISVAEPHLQDAIRLCVYTGMRLSECVKLTWDQVDLDREVISLDSRTKAKRGRAVFINPQAAEIFKRLRGTCPKGEKRVILYRHKRKGKPRPVNDIHKAWYSALEKAGLKGQYRFHDTRTAFCTALAEAGANAIDIKELAGHASITTTLRYIRAADARLKGAVNLIPDYGLEAAE